MPKRGRPAFKPTAAMRRSVEQAVSCGTSHNKIALRLKLDPDTLRKHFASELDNGASIRRQEVIDNLFNMMRKGNASAAKTLLTMTAAAEAEQELTGDTAPLAPQAEAAPKAPKLGKKEQAVEDANQVVNDPEWGTDLDTSLPPGVRAN